MYAASLPPRAAQADGCVVCGSTRRLCIADGATIRAQQRYLEEFHARRLRRRRRADDAALADRASFTQDEASAVVACAACGHMYRARQPDPEQAEETYAEDTYGEERLAALFAAQLEQFRAKLPDAAGVIGRTAPRVVEIGSFVGGFLAAAGERGWSALGIDPGEEVTAFCRRRGLQVERTTAPEASLPDAAADAVAVWNTFDQLPDPHPTLRAALRWLRTDGVLIVRVPNGEAFRQAWRLSERLPPALRPALLAAMAWNNLLSFPYLQGYTVASLDRLCAGIGLRRVALLPDTLVRLADAQSTAWAHGEERVLKLAWGAVARLAPRLSPWFDAYYRRQSG
ncbi:MAG: methyltransferase domain-containing protein [Deltaproteobacteria bacterium]|nr:methyltransferase domain-containing protein [Deltaproteobacteria bacterium]